MAAGNILLAVQGKNPPRPFNQETVEKGLTLRMERGLKDPPFPVPRDRQVAPKRHKGNPHQAVMDVPNPLRVRHVEQEGLHWWP